MKKKKSIIIVAVCVLAAAGIAAGIYGMTRKKGSPEAVNDSTAQTVQEPVSYTHLRAHETVLDLVCRLLLEKKKQI